MPTNDAAFQQCIKPDCAATYGVDQTLVACPGVRKSSGYRATTGRGSRSLKACVFRASLGHQRHRSRGPARFLGGVAVSRVAPVLSNGKRYRHHRRGAHVLQRPICSPAPGHEARQTAAAIRRAESQRQFQGQRHDRRLHPRPDGRGARVACASTGNTSASLAMFAGWRQCRGSSSSAAAKSRWANLSQALDYGALTLQIHGDFDDCLRRIREIAVDHARSSASI
jgi:threonine synthase